MLQVENLCVRYGALTVLDGVNLTLCEHEWLMLAGKNGAGKSTLLAAIMQNAPYTGRITLGGADAKGMKPAVRARRIGMLTQSHAPGYAFTVEEVVRLGRYAYSRGRLTAADKEQIEKALSETGLSARRGQSILTLSGGELQRVFLAQAFAQNPDVLLLDEPMNHLDPAYQEQLCGLIAAWVRQPGKAALSVMHDLGLAKSFGTGAVLLHEGRVLASGAADAALSRENLMRAYGMDVYAWMNRLALSWRED